MVGEDRTLLEFQHEINDAVGLGQDHPWFFGTDQDYFQSQVTYESPRERQMRQDPGLLQGIGGLLNPDQERHDASETTIRELGLEKGDRICYLFDYGDEWRFYAILKEVIEDEPSDGEPEVVNAKGDPVVQYSRHGESHRYR